MTIEVDRDVLIRALQSSTHNRVLLSRDYTKEKEAWRESLEIDGCGVTGGRVHLTIDRAKVEKPALGPAA